MFACNLRLNEEHPDDPVSGEKATGNKYAIGFPLGLTTPLNADFDGDQIAIHLVPENIKEETLQKMSPRYTYIYKKNNSQIFVPQHECLNGLCILSEVKGTPEEIEDPKHYYDSWEQLVKDAEIDHKLEYGTPIYFTGKIGSEKYNYKKTTYGRLKISKIIDRDMDKLDIWKSKKVEDRWKERISSGIGADLYKFLCGQQDKDGIEMIQKLQKAAHKAVTLAGTVTFDFATLYADTNTETYQKMRKIADDPNMSDKQKTLLLTETYKQYEKEVEGSFSDDLKNELKRANRVKLISIMDINMPQMIISSADEIPVINTGSLMQGLTEDEYIYHGVENRALQSIKQSGVPSSGF